MQAKLNGQDYLRDKKKQSLSQWAACEFLIFWAILYLLLKFLIANENAQHSASGTQKKHSGLCNVNTEQQQIAQEILMPRHFEWSGTEKNEIIKTVIIVENYSFSWHWMLLFPRCSLIRRFNFFPCYAFISFYIRCAAFFVFASKNEFRWAWEWCLFFCCLRT